ncbi:hypothetical protein ACIB24_03895 [Spongisporangium articulatum]|uniref:Transcriptional regulator, AbiEi antitoxin, Type IV TA system n=1 Tax=Spongisporangium articulatum TaxID=3362603 RepID=A0ABW8AIK4_9ACTN
MEVSALAAEQGGAVSRPQLLAIGVTQAQIEAALLARRWRRVLSGVYVTFTGPLPDLTRIWCAVLHGGRGAVASHGTALWLHDRTNLLLPSTISVSIPHERQVSGRPGLVVHRRRDLARVTAAAGSPPRVRLEVAVLDVADQAAAEEAALDPVLRAIQRRLTTADRLRLELSSRGRHRWRGLLGEMFTEVDDGVTTPLERRYVRDVERAHGLPVAERNRTEPTRRGNRYRDNRYVDFGLLVELDGLEAHPPEERHLDRARDNATAVTGQGTLRYGWRDVTAWRCATAEQVGTALQVRGWRGAPRRCGPACRITGERVDPYRLGPV